MRGFGSDNHSGAHPAVLAAMAAVNEGHVHAYGDDAYTARATEVFRQHLGEEIDVAFVFNGTGANCVCFGALCRPWESVVCPESAHVNTDECGAPERVALVKLVPVTTPDGKLTPELVRPHLRDFGFEHAVQPHVISVSNVTELGTVYSPAELRALADLAHEHGMFLHVDGARIANAAVSLGVTLRELITDSGIDALSFGGTKNGMVFGEAVVLLGEARAEHLKYVRKQCTQLPSKSRFVAAQFEAMYSGDLWRECAGNANAMAKLLAEGAQAAGVELAYQPQANEIFAWLDEAVAKELAERFHFYIWDETPDALGRVQVRWVTSWDTTDADIAELLVALR